MYPLSASLCSPFRARTPRSVGLETTKSCVEDSCIDGPGRERGEWTGDTLAVTLPILACSYWDIAPARLSLYQASEAADARGVISGNTRVAPRAKRRAPPVGPCPLASSHAKPPPPVDPTPPSSATMPLFRF